MRYTIVSLGFPWKQSLRQGLCAVGFGEVILEGMNEGRESQTGKEEEESIKGCIIWTTWWATGTQFAGLPEKWKDASHNCPAEGQGHLSTGSHVPLIKRYPPERGSSPRADSRETRPWWLSGKWIDTANNGPLQTWLKSEVKYVSQGNRSLWQLLPPHFIERKPRYMEITSHAQGHKVGQW